MNRIQSNDVDQLKQDELDALTEFLKNHNGICKKVWRTSLNVYAILDVLPYAGQPRKYYFYRARNRKPYWKTVG